MTFKLKKKYSYNNIRLAYLIKRCCLSSSFDISKLKNNVFFTVKFLNFSNEELDLKAHEIKNLIENNCNDSILEINKQF